MREVEKIRGRVGGRTEDFEEEEQRSISRKMDMIKPSDDLIVETS